MNEDKISKLERCLDKIIQENVDEKTSNKRSIFLSNEELLEIVDFPRWKNLTKADYVKIRYILLTMLLYPSVKWVLKRHKIFALSDKVDCIYTEPDIYYKPEEHNVSEIFNDGEFIEIYEIEVSPFIESPHKNES